MNMNDIIKMTIHSVEFIPEQMYLINVRFNNGKPIVSIKPVQTSDILLKKPIRIDDNKYDIYIMASSAFDFHNLCKESIHSVVVEYMKFISLEQSKLIKIAENLIAVMN